MRDLRVTQTLNSGLRASGLLVVAALALHWARYLVAYGPSAESELHRQGHGYLVEFVPVILVAAIALILGAFAVRFAWLGPERSSNRRGWATLTYAVLLLAIFGTQELAELLVTDQRSAWQAVLGEGGWLSLPLAACLGCVLAFADGRLSTVESHLASWLRSLPSARTQTAGGFVLLNRFSWVLTQGQLAFGWARRPPPQLA